MSAEVVDVLRQKGATIKGLRQVDSVGALQRSAGFSLAQPATPPGQRDFTRYTRAQVNEKPAFRVLLRELCNTLPVGGGYKGRPPIPFREAVFSCVYKSYIGLSGRRFMPDIEDAHKLGFLSKQPHHNSILRWMLQGEMTPVLTALIQGVAASFSHIETQFAVDSTGFQIPQMTQWCDAKHGWRTRHNWLKCHASVGVRSHIIAAVEVTRRNINDCTQFEPLANNTAERFRVEGVAADRAYSTVKIVERVDGMGALPAIPFKSNTNPFLHAENSAWRRMYHLFALNSPEWQEAVNRQNQAESAFSMLKRKFGEKVFSKSEPAQINEILCKVLCHNLVVVIYWLYEFGVEENFISNLTPEPLPIPFASREPPPRAGYKYDAFSKPLISLDAPVGNTDMRVSERIAAATPLPIDEAIDSEGLCSIVSRLMREQGLSRKDAWAVVQKLL